MESREFLRVKRMLLAAMLFLPGVGFMIPAYAENGSSQAVMSLFVPPSDMNLVAAKAPTPQNASLFNRYDEDTNISLTQKTGGITYRVWVAI